MEIIKAHSRPSNVRIPEIVAPSCDYGITPLGEGIINLAWVVKGTGSNRPYAIRGTDFEVGDGLTKFTALKSQYIAFNLTSRFPALGGARKLYFRVYLPTTIQIAVWGVGGNAFSTNFGAGWHTVQCDYAADGTNKYYIDGALRYSGTIRGIPDFYWNGVSGHTVLFDTGSRGGTLPAGYTWY